MSERERLPNRRKAELLDFEHNGRKWTATIGRFADGRIGEIFLDAPKESPLVELAQDCALTASLALQSGCLWTRCAMHLREDMPARLASCSTSSMGAAHD
jgi:hypothetical protein